LKTAFAVVSLTNQMLERSTEVRTVLSDRLTGSTIRPDGNRFLTNDRADLVGLWWRSPIGGHPDLSNDLTGNGAQVHIVGNPLAAQNEGNPAAVAREVSIDELSRSLIGSYVVLKIGQTGVDVIPDMAGYEVVYLVDEPGIAVAGNRPEIIARIMAAAGRPLSKDVESVCAHAFAGWADGAGTGYVGMTRLKSWSWLHVGNGAIECHRMDGQPPWRTSAPSGDYDAALEAAAATTTTAIGQIASTGFGSKILDLTGGRDTRLTLSATIRTGLVDRFQVRTIGGVKVADVRRAAEIAHRIGVEHHYGFPHPSDGLDFPDRFSSYVSATCGCVSAFDVHPIGMLLDECRVQGLAGELMREGYVKGVKGKDASETEAMLLRRFQHDRAQFLTSDALISMNTRFRSFTDGDDFADVDDCSQHYYATIRLRARFEQASSFWMTQNYLPLYSRALIDLRAFANTERSFPRIHSDLVKSLYEQAEDIPYLGEEPEGYADSMFDDKPRPEADSLMPLLRSRQTDTRRPFLMELAADSTNPAWEFLDKAAVRNAVEDVNALTMPARTRLYGALTALSWLGS
jgi:hypothetical protein